MAPAMRVSSSPAPRSLRSLPSSDSGAGRSGKGVRPFPPGPHPAFRVLGAFHRDTYSLRQRQPKEEIFQSPSYLPLSRLVGRKGKQFSGFVASFAAGRRSERLGTADGSCRRAWGAGSPFLGRRRRGLQRRNGARLGGRAKPSKARLRRSALGGGSLSLAGSRLSVLS